MNWLSRGHRALRAFRAYLWASGVGEVGDSTVKGARADPV